MKLFNFKREIDVVACVNGKYIDITDVKDKMFSQKLMGDGFAIIPSDDLIVSPVNGTIEMVFPTKHALGIKTKNGDEILLHIGIDTVDLNGEGFTVLVSEKDKVKIGQPLVKVDRQLLKNKEIDPTVIIVFASGFNNISLKEFNIEVKAKESLLKKA